MSQQKTLSMSALLLIAGLGLSGYTAAESQTETAPSTTQTAESSLYDRLGGKSAITAVVDEFVANVAADSRINDHFANTDIANLKVQLVDQICAGTGGPCIYKGGDMKSVHADMAITEADFNALVEDLIKALDKFQVPAKEQDELLGILGPMKADIVTA